MHLRVLRDSFYDLEERLVLNIIMFFIFDQVIEIYYRNAIILIFELVISLLETFKLILSYFKVSFKRCTIFQ